MVSIKLLIVLCFAVLAQARPQIKGNFDEIEELLEQLDTNILLARSVAQTKFIVILTTMRNDRNDLFQDLVEQLQREVASVLQQISEAEKKAQENGIDIDACVGDTDQLISRTYHQLLDDGADCMDDIIRDAEYAYDETTFKINVAVRPATEYETKIKRCKARDVEEQQYCIAELRADITRDIDEIPDKVDSITTETMDSLNYQHSVLTECPVGKDKLLQIEGEKIVDKISACAPNADGPPIEPRQH